MAKRRAKKKAQQGMSPQRRWLGIAGKAGAVLAVVGLILWFVNGDKTVNARVLIQSMTTDEAGVTTVEGRFSTDPERGAQVLAVRFPFKFQDAPEVELKASSGTPPPVDAVKPSHFRVRSENPGRRVSFSAKGRKLISTP